MQCVAHNSWVGGDYVCTVQPTLAGWEEIMYALCSSHQLGGRRLCMYCVANTSWMGGDHVLLCNQH